MARDNERLARAQEEPIVGGLPDVPGIGVAMRLTPGLGVHLRGLADEVLVNDYPGATLRRHEREMLATAVSAAMRTASAVMGPLPARRRSSMAVKAPGPYRAFTEARISGLRMTSMKRFCQDS